MLHKGIIIGFLIGAILGPIGFLCIRRTLTEGALMGLAVGLGAALADGTYAFVAAFGVSIVSDFLLVYTNILSIVGGLYLMYLGAMAVRTTPTFAVLVVSKVNLLMATVSTFALTLTSPVTILSFVAAFTSLNVLEQNVGYFQVGLLVLGVFLGSALWWIVLTTSSSLLRYRLTNRMISKINKASGVVIFLLGCIVLLKTIAKVIF
ncbi:LysE family translocator [Candidatus Dependentiae bacterium]|nr:LysE family translocator [Candidatus Dependentiae bacterium]